MKYISVKWKHSLQEEPVCILVELDDDRREVRKIEVFPDGRFGFADAHSEIGGTRFGTEKIPALSEIASDLQFDPKEITKQEFEQLWAKRRN